jgi:hypothetical protein
MDNKEFIGEDRKSAGISFMNANNAASSIVAAMITANKAKEWDLNAVSETLQNLRSSMLADYSVHHRDIISKTGAGAADIEIERAVVFIGKAESLTDLRRMFVSLRLPVQNSPRVAQAAQQKKQELSSEPFIQVD